jgi:uncharacterized protein (DUF58 family)
MKKSKLKSLVKTARKTAEKDIHLSLLASLKDIAGKFGENSKKLNKDIEKGARQLSKKLAKDIKINKSIFITVKEDTKVDELVAEALPVLVKRESRTAKVKVPVKDPETI